MIVLFILALLPGCRSAKPPPPTPVAVTAAERASRQAQKLSRDQNWLLAAREWEKAADQYSLLNDLGRQAIAWHNAAEAQFHLGNYPEARRLLETAAAQNEKLKSTHEWWRDQIVLLQVEAEMHDPRQLEARFARLSPMLAQVQEPALSGLFLNEQALYQLSQTNLQPALDTLKKARQAFEQARSPTGLATVTANEARVLQVSGKIPEAVAAWQKALRQFEALADITGIASSLAGLGSAFFEAGNFAPTEDCLRRAAHNYELLNQPHQEKQLLETLAKCLTAQGKHAEAEELRKKLAALPKD